MRSIVAFERREFDAAARQPFGCGFVYDGRPVDTADIGCDLCGDRQRLRWFAPAAIEDFRGGVERQRAIIVLAHELDDAIKRFLGEIARSLKQGSRRPACWVAGLAGFP